MPANNAHQSPPTGTPQSPGPRWFGRPPKLVIASLVCLLLGLIWPTATQTGQPIERVTFKQLAERIAYQRKTNLFQSLKPPYDRHRLAFALAGNDADVARIKARIDRELAAHRELKEQPVAAVFDSLLDGLAAPAIWLIVLAAALFFRPLVFVLPFGFLAAVYNTLQGSGGLYTGAASETYLGAILAGLIIAVALWKAADRLVHKA